MANPRMIQCSACGRMTPPTLIDAKDDGTGNFTVLECPACYGEGWQPLAWPLSAAQLQWMAQHAPHVPTTEARNG